jgi:hypothetical protein
LRMAVAFAEIRATGLHPARNKTRTIALTRTPGTGCQARA